MVAHAQMGGRGTLATGEPSEYDTGHLTLSDSVCLLVFSQTEKNMSFIAHVAVSHKFT